MSVLSVLMLQGEIYFVGNSNGQSSLYKIVPLAHIEINATDDEVELTVTGDEGSQVTLEKSSDLDFTNSLDTAVNGGKLTQTLTRGPIIF